MAELHTEILLHTKQESTGIAPHPVQGITVHDSDVLEPEPARPGGLMRRETVLNILLIHAISPYFFSSSDIHSGNLLNRSNLQLLELLYWDLIN